MTALPGTGKSTSIERTLPGFRDRSQAPYTRETRERGRGEDQRQERKGVNHNE